MATMSHSDSKCPIGKGLVETMSHDLLGTYRLKMTLCRVDSMHVPLKSSGRRQCLLHLKIHADLWRSSSRGCSSSRGIVSADADTHQTPNFLQSDEVSSETEAREISRAPASVTSLTYFDRCDVTLTGAGPR